MQCHAAEVSVPETIQQPLSLQASLQAINRDTVMPDGALDLPSISSEDLQKQFMFAMAVHEGAANTRKLLAQMQQARQRLLQAARTGKVSPYACYQRKTESNCHCDYVHMYIYTITYTHL